MTHPSSERIAPQTSSAVPEAFLRRVVGRLAPYVEGDAIRRSRLDRVLDAVGADTRMRTDVEAVLVRGGVRIVADQIPPARTLPRQTAARSGPTATTSGVPSAHDESEPPRPTGTGHSHHLNPAAALAAARARLDADRFTRRLDKIILTAKEECGLGMLVRGGSKEPLPAGGMALLQGEARRAAESLMLHNVRLVHSIVIAHGYSEMEHGDLAGHGHLGLIRAIERFDPWSGWKFSTYATWWIRQHIMRAIANESRLIRVPVHLYERMVKVARCRARLGIDGSPVKAVDIATELGLSTAQVNECLRLSTGVASLDLQLGDGLATLGDLLDLPAEEPEEVMICGLSPEDAAAAIPTLPERDALVIRLRFGFGEDEPWTLDEIGQRLGVTRERVRQIESNALGKLHRALASRRDRSGCRRIVMAAPPPEPYVMPDLAMHWCQTELTPGLQTAIFASVTTEGGTASSKRQRAAAIFAATACLALAELTPATVEEILSTGLPGLGGSTVGEYARRRAATPASTRRVFDAALAHVRRVR